MSDQHELRRAASAGLDLLHERTAALILDLLRTVQAVEVATGSEQPLLASGEQDLTCLLSAIRETQRDLDALAAGRLPPLPALRTIRERLS